MVCLDEGKNQGKPYEKVTKTQENSKKQESKEVNIFPKGDHKAARNRQYSMTDKHETIKKRRTALDQRPVRK